MSIEFETDWCWKRFVFGVAVDTTVHTTIMLFLGFLAIGLTFSKE